MAGAHAYASEGQSRKEQCHSQIIQEGPFTQAGCGGTMEGCGAEGSGAVTMEA